MKAKFAHLFYFAICFGFASESYGQCSVSLSGNTSICQGGSTTLTATPSGFGGSPTFVWSPSGSSSSSTVSPSSTTTYSVTANDGTCSATSTITVTVNPTPIAGFTFNNNNACAGTSVNFTSSASGGQPPYTYAWNFGGQGNSTLPNPSFTFNPGTGAGSQAYNVSLTITDNRGCSANSTQTVNVNRKPDTSIQDQDPFSPWTFCDVGGNSTLSINNSSSTQSDNTNYQINWGDGTPPYNAPTLPNGTSHTFTGQGYFNVVLTVTGSNGCTASSTYPVFAGGNPEIGLANPGGTVNVCASKSITFPITNFSNNPPGTTYTVTVNDGSAPVVYQHPPPSSYTHNFTISSCDFTSLGGFANAFHVRIIAENPCGTTSALVEPIRLGNAPTADYTFTPPPDICVGSTVDFTSTAEGNYNFNGVCNDLLTGGWTITPASGWSLVGGSLSSPDPIRVNFSQQGTYNVQLIVSNPCGSDTTIKPVCVAAAPDAEFSVPSLTGCVPLAVPTTNTSSTIGTCGNTTYAWAVTHNGSLCSSVGNWNFQSGNAGSQSPSIVFNESGTYTMLLTVTNNCGTSTESKNVTVDKIPELTIAPIIDICSGNTINPTAIINNCYSSLSNVSWSFPGGNPTSSTSQNPGAVTYNGNGTFTVTLSTTNACGTGTDNESFTIAPPPPVPVISSNSPICVGETITINANTINGVTYSWNGPGLFASNQQNITIPNATQLNSGTYTLIVADALGCTNTASINITVNPLPTVTINNPAPICVNGSVQLTAVGGNSYSWSPASGLSSTSGSTVTANPASTTTYTVTVTDGNGCSNTASVTVVVNPLPVITLNPNTSICLGESVTLNARGGASYNWSPSTGLSATTGQSVTATPIVTTTYTVTGTSAQGCSGTATTTITVNPLPNVIASATSTTICSGQSTTLSATGGTTYAWSPATGLSSTNGSPVTANPTTTTTYTVTGTNPVGCSNTANVTVTVQPLPDINVTPSAPSICIGSSVILTATGANTYVWSPATGLNATSGVTVTATPTSTTTYIVTGTDVTGCDGTKMVTVAVNPFANVSITPSNPALCTGSSTILTASGGTSYVWSPATGLSSTTGSTVTANPTSTTTYSVSVTDANGCTGTGNVTLTVNPLPEVNVIANGNNVCQGQSVTLTASGADNYTWIPLSGLSSATGSVVTANPTSTTTYFVTGTDAQGCVGTNQITVVILPPPVITITLANPGICVGSSTTITASANGGINFTWSPSTGLNTTIGATVTANPVSTTTYTVSVTDGNGCSNSNNITITVHPLPNVAVTPNNPSICLGGSATLLATGGITFDWAPATGLNTTSGGTVTASPSATTTYNVSVTDGNGCRDTGTAIVTVNPIPNVSAIANPNSICLGQSATLSASGAVDYTWAPAAGLSSTTGSTVTANPTSTTTYIVTGTSGQNCQDTGMVTLTILPLPVINITPNNPAICIGNSVTLNATGGVNYTWSPAMGLNITSGDAVIANPSSTTTYIVSATDGSGCSDSKNAVVTVNPLPSVDAGPPQIFCNQPIPVQLSGNPNGGTWSGQGVTSTGIFTPGDTGTINIDYTFTEPITGCSNSDNTIITVVDASPANTGTDHSICVGSISFTMNGNPAGGTWSGNPHINANGTFNPTQPGIFYAVYSIGTGTCFDTDTAVVTVHSLPTVIAGNDLPVCADALPFNMIGNTPTGGTWSGTGITNITLGTFNPSMSGIGTHTVTYSFSDNNGCSNSASRNVIVNPLPVVDAGSEQTLCNQPIPVQLSGSPLGGTWSGNGITPGGLFTPSDADTGRWRLTYTYTNSDQCTNIDSAFMNVIAAPYANSGPDFAVCRDGSPIDLNTNNNPDPTGGIWNGTGVANNFFHPATASIGPNSIVYSIGTGTCIAIDTCVIMVNPLPIISVNSLVICESNSDTLKATGAITYNWTPTTWLSDSVGASVVASPVVTVSYTVRGTDANGCTNISNTSVTVNPLPAVDADAPQTFCNQLIPVQLNGNPSGGTWNGNGIAPGGLFTPSDADTGRWILTYSYTDVNNCSNFDTTAITVVDATLADAGPGLSLCITASPVDLNTVGIWPPNGTWSGTGVSGNVFNPASANSGQHVLTYSIGTGTCLSNDTAMVLVNPQPVISVNSPTICLLDTIGLNVIGADNYIWSPANTLSSASGSIVQAFPSVTTLYSIIGTNALTGCDDTITTTVTVLPLPVVDVDSLRQFCDQNIPEQLTGTPSSGVWSGQGVTPLGLFTPSDAGLGTWMLIYSLTDGNNCTNRDTLRANVITPDVADAGKGDTACVNDSRVLPIDPYPATGGIWSGLGIVDSVTGLFDPSVAGEGIYQVHYTLGSGTCLTSDSREIFVIDLPVIAVNPNIPEACFRQDITLQASGAVTYSWSPATGLNTTRGSTVIANIDSTETYDVTGTNAFGCSDIKPVTVLINQLPIVTSSPDTSMCNQNNFSIQLSGTPNGGTWTGTFTTSDGLFNPSGNPSDVGIYNITYAYTDQHGCTDSSATTVEVIAPIFAQAGPRDTFCLNDSPIVLQGFSPLGGIFSGPGITNIQSGLFDPAVAGTGVKNIRYSFGSGTCLTHDSTSIRIRELPKPDFTHAQTCIGESTQFTDISLPFANVISSWQWNFGDSISSNTKNPFHTYAAPGDYSVTLAVMNSNGCSNDTTILVTVHPLPTVGFTHPDLACPDSLITFTLNTVDAIQYDWDFGDGTTATGVNPLHIYTVIDTFMIKLWAETQFGCEDSAESEIQVGEHPEADFALSPNSGCGPLAVSIRYLPQNLGTLSDFTWDLGNGDFAYTMIPPEAIYPGPVNQQDTFYVVTLWVQSRACQQVVMHRDTVHVTAAPTVEIKPVSSIGCSPLTITLESQATGAADSIVVDFGDGTGTVLQSSTDITHTFANTTGRDASYWVRYSAYYSCGIAHDSLRVTVHPSNVDASISVNSDNNCVNQKFTLTNHASGAQYIYYDLGTNIFNPNSDLSPNIHLSYDSPGEYNIYQYVYSADSCGFDSDSLKVNVAESPNGDFEMAEIPYSCGGPVVVDFINNSTGATVYHWDFGDGIIGNSINGVNGFTSSGTFNITLIAENDIGCKDTMIQPLLIDYKQNGLYVPNAFSPEFGDPKVRLFKPAGKCLDTYHLRIFNEWGELVWETDRITADGEPAEGWDGRHMNTGLLLQQDVYVWKIEATFTDNEVWAGKPYDDRVRKIGSVTLLR